jgi:hypothetical protein
MAEMTSSLKEVTQRRLSLTQGITLAQGVLEYELNERNIDERRPLGPVLLLTSIERVNRYPL